MVQISKEIRSSRLIAYIFWYPFTVKFQALI